MSGFGNINWPDGSKYTGKWQDGEMHGKGTLVTADGCVVDGFWVKDNL
jgi:hypothetical protein